MTSLRFSVSFGLVPEGLGPGVFEKMTVGDPQHHHDPVVYTLNDCSDSRVKVKNFLLLLLVTGYKPFPFIRTRNPLLIYSCMDPSKKSIMCQVL